MTLVSREYYFLLGLLPEIVYKDLFPPFHFIHHSQTPISPYFPLSLLSLLTQSQHRRLQQATILTLFHQQMSFPSTTPHFVTFLWNFISLAFRLRLSPRLRSYLHHIHMAASNALSRASNLGSQLISGTQFAVGDACSSHCITPSSPHNSTSQDLIQVPCRSQESLGMHHQSVECVITG